MLPLMSKNLQHLSSFLVIMEVKFGQIKHLLSTYFGIQPRGKAQPGIKYMQNVMQLFHMVKTGNLKISNKMDV